MNYRQKPQLATMFRKIGRLLFTAKRHRLPGMDRFEKPGYREVQLELGLFTRKPAPWTVTD